MTGRFINCRRKLRCQTNRFCVFSKLGLYIFYILDTSLSIFNISTFSIGFFIILNWCDTFELDTSDADTRREIEGIYGSIELPKRATVGSAGYDFFAPLTLNMKPGDTVKVPTGIRCKINEGWVLKCYPRSGLGFKYRLQLDNTVGIIDSDYYDSDNEGHIFIKVTNDSKRPWKNLNVLRGEGFAQGIFVEYGITIDDEAAGVRNGGFGSTTENK